jgi:cellulose synthase/poly-beta-1,6-N-acetylglucosamine synthase-like glycosyltransferase
MKAPLEVSVVVATHNRAERLGALLQGLRAQTFPSEAFEVVIVDDASSDRTPDILEQEHRRGQLRVRTFRNEDALGPATARNRGWRMAGAPLIAFTDDDCVPTETWLESLIAAAGDSHDAIVAGRTLPNPSEAHALGPYAKTVRIAGPSPHYETCNVAYPRALLERVGGFDESYPSPAGEDSDLGCRATAAGGRLVFSPDALVHHAVFRRGPIGALQDALLATEGVQAYKQNPGLRAHLPGRVFYGRPHPLLLAAVGGMWLARRRRLAALLILPYVRNVLNRCSGPGARRLHAPFFVVFDVVQLVATIRGAVRNRVPII